MGGTQDIIEKAGLGALTGGLGLGVSLLMDNKRRKEEKSALSEQKRIAGLKAEHDDKARRSLLRQEISSYKAKAGALGLDTDEGSAKAIIDGMVRRSEEDSEYAKTQSESYMNSLDRRRNLLGSSLYTIGDGLAMADYVVGSLSKK